MGVRRGLALLIGGALLAGCGGSSEAPAQLPKVTARQAAAVSVPASATADTPAGAAAFTRFFYSQVT